MGIGIFQVSSELDKQSREIQEEVIWIVSNVYEYAFEIAKEEYLSTGKISPENRVSENYIGALKDGSEFTAYVVIKELEPAMGDGFGCWITQFQWR